MSLYSLKNVYDVLKGTNFYTDHMPYIFYKLNKSDFSSLAQEISQYSDVYAEIIHDKDELTIILPKELWNLKFASKFTPVASMGDIALITCEVQQETQTGYLLALVGILSPHNISVYVQGAYTTDHIFVDFKQLDEALKLLNQLKG